ncbi:MAG TPA: hypothetical protein VKL22_00105 [Actinomycetota bacterium]|nr:hypothetical protein [Actinomycetota bacterium]
MAETHSIATIVFTDMVGSTALRARLGEEQADRLRRIHAIHLLSSDSSVARGMLAEAADICEKHALAALGQRIGRVRAAG